MTALQFDSRKIVAAAGENGVKVRLPFPPFVSPSPSPSPSPPHPVLTSGYNGEQVYNRTTMQHSTLQTNGHTAPVERLRFMDRYLATGGRDATVKIWALQ